MTMFDRLNHPNVPTILPPGEQRAVWFLGALIRVRAGGSATAGQLAILEHARPRGYNSPPPQSRRGGLPHPGRRAAGRSRGQAVNAGPGTAAVLPRQLPQAFVVTNPQARFLTLHTPAGFDEFTLAVGSPARSPFEEPPDELPPDLAALGATAASYGIEILGPPPSPS